MTKYGMAFTTIQYWQMMARQHVYYMGDAGVFQRSLMFKLRPSNISTMPAREIGHSAIQCAAVCHPSAIKVALK